MLFQTTLGATPATTFTGGSVAVLSAVNFRGTLVHTTTLDSAFLQDLYKKGLDAATAFGPQAKAAMTAGALPFVIFKSALDGSFYGAYFNGSVFQMRPSSDVLKTPLAAALNVIPSVLYITDDDDQLNAYLGQFKGQAAAANVQAACAKGDGAATLRSVNLSATGSAASKAVAVACKLYGMPAMQASAASFTTRPTATTPQAPQFPPGSITRFNTTRKVWVVYAPQSALKGLDEAPLPVPPPPTDFVKVAEQADQPAGVPVSGNERDSKWYDSKLLWAGAGVVVLGGGYWWWKRR